jgi:hypothetical protein
LNIGLLVTLGNLSAAEYYVATNGDDSGAGTIVDPFRTIQKAASIMVAGDTCYIRQGVYRETVTPANSGAEGAPITFTAYNAESVTISGADLVTGWTIHEGSIYKAAMNWDLGEGFNQVFVGGEMVNRARWPNTTTDLLSPTTASGSADSETITFVVSRPTDYWSGGTVYGHFGHKWTGQGATITASTSSGQLSLSDKTNPWFSGSGGGYITGIFGELDTEEEWFLTGGSLYLWAPGSVDPSTLTVEAKARKWCFDFAGQSYIRIVGLNMIAGSVKMNGTHGQLSECTFQYLSHFTRPSWSAYAASGNGSVGDNGIYVSGSNNLISHCTILDTAGSGVILLGTENTLTRSVIRHINYSGTYSCPVTIARGSGGSHKILFNTIHDAGRDLIQLSGAKNDRVMHNHLYNPGRICKDLGIVYAWGADGENTEIAYNWVHDNPLSAPAPGIYIDNFCRRFIIHHNVVWNIDPKDTGIRLNGPADLHFVYNNTLFNCRPAGERTYSSAYRIQLDWWDELYPDNEDIYNVVIENNLYLANDPESQLGDPENYKFWLKEGAAAIDAGQTFPPYTNGWQGTAPDLGAYETGGPRWTAGHNGVSGDSSDPLPDLQ